MNLLRIRLMPAVMTAAGALLALKAVGLATHSSILFVPAAHASEETKPSADAKPAAETKPVEAKPALPPDTGVRKVATERLNGENAPIASGSAQPLLAEPPSAQPALVEALSRRREQLDSRSAEIDLRENLLKAAEKRLEDRLQELKRVEETIASEDKKRTDEEQARYKDLVTMYETMKVKQAAAIFEKLDARVLLEVAAMMKPSKLSEIMGVMAPDAAQRLTVSLARRDVGPPPAAIAANDLPKIGARPASQ